ncbi:hypothetical protein WUBG_13137, partial [Wuchereria bancrofti]
GDDSSDYNDNDDDGNDHNNKDNLTTSLCSINFYIASMLSTFLQLLHFYIKY